MTTSQTTKTETSSLTGDVLRTARYSLGNWRALLIIALAAILAGLALNWSWLVAAGIAPILLTTLPCLVMCGLGLCINKMVGGASASQPSQPDQAGLTQSPDSTAQAPASRSSLTYLSSCCGVGSAANNSTNKPKT